MELHTSVPAWFKPKFTNGHGNRHQRRRQARIRNGLRRAAMRADTGACLVEREGVSVADAAVRCGSCPPYVAAMLIIRASGHSMLRDRVLRGEEPVLEAAKAVENVAKAIPAYRKFSPLERELFRMATGATADLAKHLRNSTSEQLVATTKAVTPEWIFDRMIAPSIFTNKTGKVAPEHKRLSRYSTMTLDEIMALPVAQLAAPTAHIYLWCPNALLPDGLAVMKAWGFSYKSNIVWHKIRKDGGSDGRGVGFYFRNVTELILFGVRGKNARTLAPGRRQVNYIETRKREHSRKPDEQYEIIEACSPGPFVELFARGTRKGWMTWGNEASVSFTEAVAITEADNARLTDGARHEA